MAVAIVRSGANYTNGNDPDLDVSLTGTPTDDNLLLFFAFGGPEGSGNITFTWDTGFTELEDNADDWGVAAGLAWKLASSEGANPSYRVTPSSTNEMCAFVYELSGAPTITPIRASNVWSSGGWGSDGKPCLSGTTDTSPQSDDFALFAWGLQQSTPTGKSYTNSFTEDSTVGSPVDSNDVGGGVATKTLTASGAVSTQLDYTSTERWGSGLIVVVEADAVVTNSNITPTVGSAALTGQAGRLDHGMTVPTEL